MCSSQQPLGTTGVSEDSKSQSPVPGAPMPDSPHKDTPALELIGCMGFSFCLELPTAEARASPADFPGSSVQLSCSVVSDSVTPRTAACQASLSTTNSRSLFKLMSIELDDCCHPTISSSVVLFSSHLPRHWQVRNKFKDKKGPERPGCGAKTEPNCT